MRERLGKVKRKRPGKMGTTRHKENDPAKQKQSGSTAGSCKNKKEAATVQERRNAR